jgi:glycine cleavage system H protein
MKTFHKIAALSLLSIFLLLQLQDSIAASAVLDKLSAKLKEMYAFGNATPTESPSIKLTFSPEAGVAVALPLGRDAIVFIAGSNNPNIELMRTNGISFEWIREQIANGSNSIVIDNEFVYERLMSFLNLNSADVPAHPVKKLENLNSSIGVILNSELRQMPQSSQYVLIPIDRNGNGKLEANESFYTDFSEFSRAVWLGKYPKALSLTLYASVPASQLQNPVFIQWIYTEGTQLASSNGFMPLNSHEILAHTTRFSSSSLSGNEAEASSTIPVWLIFILVLTATSVLIFVFFLSITKPYQPVVEASTKASSFGAGSFRLANGRMYDKTHTWAFLEENGLVKVGFDDFVNKVFGNQAVLQLLNSGDRFSKGDIMAIITHLGRKVEVKAPISGRIVAVNQSNGKQDNANSQDWIYKIEPDNWKREQGFLFLAEQHKEWLNAEFLRFREFLANATRVNHKETQLIMLDGGEVIEGVMQHVEPQVWEEFQKSFMQVKA